MSAECDPVAGCRGRVGCRVSRAVCEIECVPDARGPRPGGAGVCRADEISGGDATRAHRQRGQNLRENTHHISPCITRYNRTISLIPQSLSLGRTRENPLSPISALRPCPHTPTHGPELGESAAAAAAAKRPVGGVLGDRAGGGGIAAYDEAAGAAPPVTSPSLLDAPAAPAS